jgi:hypothetical protein
MGNYTPTQLDTVVADHLNMSASELPSSAKTHWYRSASDEILERSRRWPFLSDQWSFSTTASDGYYLFSDMEATDTIGHIKSMGFDSSVSAKPLTWISHKRMNELIKVSSSGLPRYYTTTWYDFAGAEPFVRFYPTPDAAYTVYVDGWRTPPDWVAADTVSPFPAAFDDFIVDYAVARLYLHQEVGFMADKYEAQAYKRLERLYRRWHAMPTAEGPQIMGREEGYLPGRLLYGFEVR